MNEEIELLKNQVAALEDRLAVMQGRSGAAQLTLAVMASCLSKDVAWEAAQLLRLRRDQLQGQLLGSQMTDAGVDWLNRELDGYLTQLDGAAGQK